MASPQKENGFTPKKWTSQGCSGEDSGDMIPQVDTQMPHSKALRVLPDAIPAELKQIIAWVVWRYELSKDEKWTKVPYQLDGQTRASSTDPGTWGTFPEALKRYTDGGVDGVGIVLTKELGIVGIDLDHCRDGGTITPEALQIIEEVNGYSEVSPSGTGIRILVEATLPPGRRKKGDIEMYDTGRYLTVTGHHLTSTSGTIERRQEAIDTVHGRVFGKPKTEHPNSNRQNGHHLGLGDDVLLRTAFGAQNGHKIKALYEGDINGYPSQSEADLALCSLLAFYTEKKEQLDRLFRGSALYREKWDEKRGATTWGEQTVQKAIENRTERYESRDNGKQHNSQHKYSSGPYRIENGCIVRIKHVKDELIAEPLCNFNARVTEEIILDDGVETTRAFVIEGQLDSGETLSPARIPASRFNGMNWVTDTWGLRAVVRAGSATRDYLREAIQRLSPNARHRQVFKHTGWREIKGQWIYLTTNGAVGKDDFEVDLGSELSRYRLPREIDDPVGAMRISLQLLDTAPLVITAPLWASVFRAPLASAYPVDLSIWLEGLTGSLKSTLAALFLSHFGDFYRTDLPGAWSSTVNQLEYRAFTLKDVLFVIDDYAPTALDNREMQTKSARLLRSQGNLAGRGRLRSDLSERPAFIPRGLILSTGEQHPPGQSLLARTLLIELERNQVNMGALTKSQDLTGRLPHAMAGYISWLGPQMSKMPSLLRETFRGARAKATFNDSHLRIPEALAHLWLGLHCGLTYAEEIKAISAIEAKDLLKNCWNALLSLAKTQRQFIEEERSSHRFLRVLATLITQGRAVLLPKDETGNEPQNNSEFLGWRDEDYLYLIPDAAFMAVSRFCRDTGEPLSTRLGRLKRDLSEDKVSEVDQDRLTTTIKINTKTRRVLRLKIEPIEDLLGEEFPATVTGSHQYHQYGEDKRDAV